MNDSSSLLHDAAVAHDHLCVLLRKSPLLFRDIWSKSIYILGSLLVQQ